MKIGFIFYLSLLFVACSSFQARKSIYSSEITLKGGVAGEKRWTESLVMKRISWFSEATMGQEILWAKLDKASPFTLWLGSQKHLMKDCSSLYLFLIYADINSQQGISFLKNELLARKGTKGVELLDFSYQLKSHENFHDWKLSQHKAIGICSNSQEKEVFTVTLPGFQSYQF